MNKIFYFSGTGNSMRAAEIIAEKLGNTEIISMRSDQEDISTENCEVIGFIFPVYHWTMPLLAQEFIEKLKINSKAYIFCVAMPSFVCGCACECLENILKNKNLKISYGNKVYCVANYCLVYPPLPPEKLIVPRTEKKLNEIAHDIIERKEREIPRANFIIKKKIDKTMSKYKPVLKYADLGFKITDDCIGCGTCERVCPANNIEIMKNKPIFKNKCQQCMACVSYCPKKAIEYKLDENELKEKGIDTKKVKIIKIMKLTKKSKRYNNPYITSSELSKKKKIYNSYNKK